MTGSWCGLRAAWIALSVGLSVACGSESHELGHEPGQGGEGAEGGSLGGSGGKGGGTGGLGNAGSDDGGTAGTSGKGGSSGTGGDSGSAGNAGNAGNAGVSGNAGVAGTMGGSGGFAGTLISDVEDLNVFALRPPPTKLDLLLMVDNSIGAGDKQALLAQAMPSLLRRFTRPNCVDASGAAVGEVDESGACQSGAPEFPPVADIHVGVISSSLGDHGSNDVCSDAQDEANQAMPGGQPANYNDKAQLLPSVRSNAGSTDFLTWDAGDDAALDELAGSATAQVTAAGSRGCGYEAQLESWYRFLVDPEPVATVTNDGAAIAVRGAVNATVIEQRAAFLRPDSAVAIVMLTDENDCSVIDENGYQGWLVGFKGGVGKLTWHMPRASAACVNANDPCCRPCSTPPSAGCPANDADAACSMGDVLTINEDSMNQRCFAQTKRFGIDLLYPVSRYVAGITERFITPRFGGAQVQNPLYAPAADGSVGRDPSSIYLAGIVGVPWQDIATEDSWSGRSLKFMTAAELQAKARWDVILGSPLDNVSPTDPFMIESIDPRPTGIRHPLLNDEAVQAAGGSGRNQINGAEQVVTATRDDLQFACTFELNPPYSAADCEADADACNCNADEFEKRSPLCEGTTAEAAGAQLRAAAYPGLRELEVLKGVGNQAVVASACPKNVTVEGGSPAADPDYGYNPAVHAVADRLGETLGGSCLTEPLPVDADGRARCTLIEARPQSDCSCEESTGRSNLPDEPRPEIGDFLSSHGLDAYGQCLCEVTQLDNDDPCNYTGSPTNPGFCYIDPEQTADDAELVGTCRGDRKRRLRFVGDGLPASNALLFLTCSYG